MASNRTDAPHRLFSSVSYISWQDFISNFFLDDPFQSGHCLQLYRDASGGTEYYLAAACTPCISFNISTFNYNNNLFTKRKSKHAFVMLVNNKVRGHASKCGYAAPSPAVTICTNDLSVNTYTSK